MNGTIMRDTYTSMNQPTQCAARLAMLLELTSILKAVMPLSGIRPILGIVLTL